jgi:hypothetical protein
MYMCILNFRTLHFSCAFVLNLYQLTLYEPSRPVTSMTDVSSNMELATLQSPVEMNRRHVQRPQTSDSMSSDVMNKSLVYYRFAILFYAFSFHCVCYSSGICFGFCRFSRHHSFNQDRESHRWKFYCCRCIPHHVFGEHAVSLASSLNTAEPQLHSASGNAWDVDVQMSNPQQCITCPFCIQLTSIIRMVVCCHNAGVIFGFAVVKL